MAGDYNLLKDGGKTFVDQSLEILKFISSKSELSKKDLWKRISSKDCPEVQNLNDQGIESSLRIISKCLELEIL